jgi:hypothetical protein
MEKKSKLLIAFVLLALVASVAYAYCRYVWTGDFLIDESQIEEVEPLPEDEMLMGEVPVENEVPEPTMVENE